MTPCAIRLTSFMYILAPCQFSFKIQSIICSNSANEIATANWCTCDSIMYQISHHLKLAEEKSVSMCGGICIHVRLCI